MNAGALRQLADALMDTALRQLADALADAGAALTRAALLAPEATPGADDLSEAGDALMRAAEAVETLMDQRKPVELRRAGRRGQTARHGG